MLKNYLIVAVRNLLRYKVYSLINVLGLAVGMACCILILLYVQDELNYDRHHEKGDRIYRVLRERHVGTGSSSVNSGISGAMAPALRRDFPEVEQAVRVMDRSAFVRYKDKIFEQRICISEAPILEMFTFPLVEGDLQTALRDPFSILITQETARKFFGNENPMGKAITSDDRYVGGDYKITGILKDIPENSTFSFDFLTATIPERYIGGVWDQWRGGSGWRPFEAYILLREGHSHQVLEAKLPDFIERYMGEEVQVQNTYYLQPYTRIYLYSRVDYNINWYGDIANVYVFSTVALFILLIACINFMNLATARSASRAQEVGMRKVVGAYRMQLIGQFLGESVLLSIIAFLLAIGLAELVLSQFNSLVYKELSLIGSGQIGMLVGLPFIAVFVGFLSGSYPAFFLSALRPVEVLKGSLKVGTKSAWLRKGLVVFQFSISVLLIIGTVVVYLQLEYMNNKKLGFNKEHIVLMPIFYRDRLLCDRYDMVKNEFLQHPSVLKATASHSWGALGGQLETVRPEGAPEDEWQMRIVGIDEDFLDTYEVELLAGRNLSRDIASDSTRAFLLNETAVKQLGWTDPVGKQFDWQDGANLRMGRVIGVVRDFHNQSLREKIPPVVICKWQRVYNTLSLRISGEDVPGTMHFLEEKWKELVPAFPFEAMFMDEALEGMYQRERRFGEITGIFSLLAVFVACLGLLALASFTAQQRTREIGIRKALGASAPSVVMLLSEEFLKLVLVANLIAWPLAYYGLDDWLQSFEYRVSLDPMAFMLSGILTLLIALATVSFQAVKAALINPVEALRDE